jgi:hypothetical protein
VCDDDCVEVSEKENANHNEESFAKGDIAKGDFILVNQARNRGIYHNIAEVVNNFFEYEMR